MKRATSCLIFLAFFMLYARTSCPTLYVGDDGDLITAASMLGIPHPSGYPLFCLLVKLGMLVIPFSNIAARTNLLCAAFSALALVLLYKTARTELSSLAALVAAILLGLSPSFWSQSTAGRVYALNMALSFAILYLALSPQVKPKLQVSAGMGLLCGLAFTNHLIVIPVVAAALGLLTFRAGHDWPRHLSLAALFGLFGASVYLYLPLRTMADLPLDWGNPESWRNFMAVLLRSDFWYKHQVTDFISLKAALARFYQTITEEFKVPLLPALPLIIPLGFYRRSALVAASLFIGFCSLGLVFSHGSEYDLFHTNRYYLPCYAMLSLLTAYGLHSLLRLLLAPRFLRLVLPLTGLIALTAYATGRFYLQDASECYILYDYANNILKTPEPNATLLALRDNEIFSLLYMRFVEGWRPDLQLYNTAGVVLQNSHIFAGVPLGGEKRDQLEEGIIAAAKDDVYYCEPREILHFGRYSLQPWGIIYKIILPSQHEIELFSHWENYIFRGIYRPHIGDEHMIRDILDHYFQATKQYSQLQNFLTRVTTAEQKAEQLVEVKAKAKQFNEIGLWFVERKMYGIALNYFLRAFRSDENNRDIVMNVALAQRETGNYDATLELVRKLLAKNPEDAQLLRIGAETYEQGLHDTANALEWWQKLALATPGPEARSTIEHHIETLKATQLPRQ